MKKLLAVVVLAASALLVGSADAKTCVWTGAGANGKWTNPDNWQGGEIPGRITVNSVLSGEGGDIAEFGAVAAGAKTTIDMTGVTSIGGIKVVGADAPAYTFGTARMYLETDGFGVYVDEDVSTDQTIGYEISPAYATESATQLTIRNEGSGILNLPSLQTPSKDPSYSGSTGTVTLDLRGAGDIRLKGACPHRNYKLLLNQTGKLRIGCTMYETSYRPPWYFTAGNVAPVSRIEVEDGVTFTSANQYGNTFIVEDSDLEIFGSGTFGFQYVAKYDGNETRVKISNGRTLTISCHYVPLNNGTAPGIRTYNVTGGALVFSGENTTKGPLQNFFGTMATDQPGGFGLGEVQLASDSVLRYFGDADWTMTQDVCVTNWPNRTTLSGKIETVAGKGVWTLAGGFSQHNSSNSGTGTFTLQGDGEGVVSGIVANGDGSRVTALAKSGSGTWTLAGENTFTGATTLNDGTLKVAATGSLASSSGVTVKGGVLAFEGDVETATEQSLAKISISGNGTLVLSGKVTVTAASVSRTSGKVLAVVTDSTDAKLVVPAGTSADAFTWNGQPAVIGEDGEVRINADAVIAARGDVVPDNGGKVVIFDPGTTGNDMLAADTTTLAKLTQLSKTAAMVEIGECRKLVVPAVALCDGTANLTLGAAGDEGMLDSPTKVISFDNLSVDSKITLNAAIGEGVTNEFAHGRAAIAGDTTLGFTKIAIVDKAKAQLEICGCTVETGFEPIQIGANTGNDYNNGGMQYGEITVSNAVIRNVADLARTSHSYSTPNDYGILVGKNASGILRVQDGAVISNKLQIGTGINGTSGRGSGAVYQSGGTVCTIGGAGYKANAIGNGSAMGFYELAGGSFNGRMAIGTYGIGIWHQEPGTTADLEELISASANGGRADVYFRGRVTAASGGMIGGGYQNGGISLLTIDGPAASVNGGSGSIYAFVSDTTAVNTSRVNVVHGGKIRCARLYNNSKSGTPSRLTVSFDGGTFVCGYKGYQEVFGADRVDQRVDDILVYPGGMTVETVDASAANGTAVAIRRPEGGGVVSIPFDYASFAEWNCPPFIRITGDGDGATAHALFDSSKQCVTGVVITCAGTGYKKWAKATAIYGGNSCPSAKSVDCVLDDNIQSGGFTKSGPGTFTLFAANTWGGATVAAGGTLKAGCDWAIPADSAVVLAGGKIDFGGKAGSVSKVTYTVGGGSIVNAENVTLPVTFDMAITADEILAGRSIPLAGDQDLTGKTLTITGDFSSLDPTVCRKYTVVSVSGGTISGKPKIVAPALPEDWTFVTRPNGVKLVVPQGMTLIVR